MKMIAGFVLCPLNISEIKNLAWLIPLLSFLLFSTYGIMISLRYLIDLSVLLRSKSILECGFWK